MFKFMPRIVIAMHTPHSPTPSRSNTIPFPHFYNPALSQPYASASTITSTIFKNLSRYSIAVVVMLIGPLPFPLWKKFQLFTKPVNAFACNASFAQKKSSKTARYTHFPSLDTIPERHGEVRPGGDGTVSSSAPSLG